MHLKEKVQVTDRFEIRDDEGNVRSYSEGPRDDGPVIEGRLRMLLRERGKIVPGSRREGKNIWTLTGREYLAQLMSYGSLGPNTAIRNDRILYIGFGIGSQPEVSSVSKLVSPVPFDALGGSFLASLAVPSFPLTPARTTVSYGRVFSETQLSIDPPGTPVVLSEAGLFTDGAPEAIPAFNPGTRNVSIAVATLQAPVAYKAFDPLKKTVNFEFEVFWEIRF